MTTPHLRPSFHLTPPRNWLNDPNGLVVVDGVYHAYFQHNPEGNDWGNMSWGHMSSPDLVRWSSHPVALSYEHDELIFSGSIVVDLDDTAGFGPGSLVAVYTSVAPGGRQAQSLAHSDDGGHTWTKFDGNPVLNRDSDHFRDPKVSRQVDCDGRSYWLMTVVEAAERTVLFYRSPDLRNWEHLSSFSIPDDSRLQDVEVWECPDLVHVPPIDRGSGAWLLIVSVNPGAPNGGSGTMYFLGDFDGVTFTPFDVAPRWLDHGTDYYAAVTFSNTTTAGHHTQVLTFGWMSNWKYAALIPTDPWRGGFSLPRQLSVSGDGGAVQLCQQVPAEFGIGRETIDLPAFRLEGERRFTSDGRFRLQVSIEVAGAREIALDFFDSDSDGDGNSDGHGQTARTQTGPAIGVSYSVADELLTLQRRAVGAAADIGGFATTVSARVPLHDRRLDLIVWVDAASIEVQTSDGTTWFTMLVLPDANATGWSIAAIGGTATVSSLALTNLDERSFAATRSTD